MLTRFLTAATLGCAVMASPALAASADVPADTADNAAKAMAVPNDNFPAEWFWARDEANWEKINSIVGKKATDLVVGDWHNGRDGGQPKKIEDYAGKPLIIDFWGTWCGPCLAAAPKVSALAEKYEDKINVIAVCNTARGDKMVEAGDKAGMKIPTAMDLDDKTKDAYGVQWWPYYVAIDSKGIVRAAGISSAHVEDVMKKMIEIEAGETEQASVPMTPLTNPNLPRIEPSVTVQASWLEGSEEKRGTLNAMHGKKAPAFTVESWMNSEALTPDKLKGKIVVVDFWATWCGPCIASIPKNNEIAAKYKDKGVVFIGVCHPRGVEKMGEVVEEKGIEFPVAADTSGSTNEAFNVNSYPDYYIIGRDGTVVVADARNDKVEEILDAMLKTDATN
ncbi:MAG: TlpA family protein disulfide reductase [Phycisphaerales bacterium]